jgi:hypothetical protein
VGGDFTLSGTEISETDHDEGGESRKVSEVKRKKGRGEELSENAELP